MFGSECALIEASRHRENHRWTYRGFRSEVGRIAAWMLARGVGADSRVAILMTNQSRWLVAAAAALRVGAVVVPLDYKLRPAEVDALLGYARPELLITEHGLGRRLEHTVPVLAVDSPASAELSSTWTRWEALPDAAPPPITPRSREDIAALVYSSGTGGTPKGCLLSHGAYLAQLEGLVGLYPMEPGERFFSILPTNHAIDFMCGFLAPFACGATVVHQRTLRPEFLRGTLQRYAITHMAAVPMVLESFKTAIEDKLDALGPWQRAAVDGLISTNRALTERKPRPELSQRLLRPILSGVGGSLKLVFTGGAYVRPELAEFFYGLGIGVAIGYGLTEACTVLTVNDLRPFRADSVGAPVPGTELRIARPDPEGVGEVEVRGPTLMSGYDGAPELTAAAFTEEGWLRTGDLGWVDASGHLHLVGRARNMIVSAGGKNVYPEDLEGAFGEVDCEELAVFAADYLWPRVGGLGEEQLVIVVHELRDPAALSRANRSLPDFKRVAGQVRWAEPFPRTASLKLQRTVLANQVREALTRDAVEGLG